MLGLAACIIYTQHAGVVPKKNPEWAQTGAYLQDAACGAQSVAASSWQLWLSLVTTKVHRVRQSIKLDVSVVQYMLEHVPKWHCKVLLFGFPPFGQS